jgi:hypothetical protein
MGRTACTEPQCLYKGALYLYLTFEIRWSRGRIKTAVWWGVTGVVWLIRVVGGASSKKKKKKKEEEEEEEEE